MKSHSFEDESGLVKRLSKGNLLAFNTLFEEYSVHWRRREILKYTNI
jgi:hypothetical protein